MGSSTYNAPNQKRSNNGKDLISLLMDEILIYILSFLETREAAKTSVLSKRWRYLWANLRDFNFDGSETLAKLKMARGYGCQLSNAQEYAIEARKFVDQVNQLVSSYGAARHINKFRVRFLLHRIYGVDINRWVNFAMQKSVKELELNFSNYFGQSPYGSPMVVYFDSFWFNAQYAPVTSLVSLTLAAIQISSGFIKSVLHNCPNLERLTLKWLYCNYQNMKVAGCSLKLQYLEIWACQQLKGVEISAKNLISFVFIGDPVDIIFRDVPLLREASFAGVSSTHLICNLHLTSSFSSHLEKLTLKLLMLIPQIYCNQTQFPTFDNIKQLEITFACAYHQNLLVLTNLIAACPLLHKLKLQRYFGMSGLTVMGNLQKEIYQHEGSKTHHHHLKVVEFLGYVGDQRDLEFILHVSKFAIMLEKVILGLLEPSLMYTARNPNNLLDRRELLELKTHGWSNKKNCKLLAERRGWTHAAKSPF